MVPASDARLHHGVGEVAVVPAKRHLTQRILPVYRIIIAPIRADNRVSEVQVGTCIDPAKFKPFNGLLDIGTVDLANLKLTICEVFIRRWADPWRAFL